MDTRKKGKIKCESQLGKGSCFIVEDIEFEIATQQQMKLQNKSIKMAEQVKNKGKSEKQDEEKIQQKKHL